MALDLSMPILVVDDYQTMVRIIRNLLKQLGFEDVDDASDGTTALAKLKQKKYGLVISDWNMEPMTGYELLRHVREDENLRAMPVALPAEPILHMRRGRRPDWRRPSVELHLLVMDAAGDEERGQAESPGA